MDHPCTQCHSGFCSAHQHPEHAVWERITQEHAALGNQVTAFAAAIRNAALEEAAQAAYTALFPTNDRSDWTEFAEGSAYGAKYAAECIRALKSE